MPFQNFRLLGGSARHTRRINDLNEKLDRSVSVIEPRENAYIDYDSHQPNILGIDYAGSKNTCLIFHSHFAGPLRSLLAQFGQTSVSKTFPPLCKASVQSATAHIDCQIEVRTVDYYGNLQNRVAIPSRYFYLVCNMINPHPGRPPPKGV